MASYSFANPWAAPGEFLKGNLHTHTTLSDGKESPEERAGRYRARGYDFLALTDHGRIAPVGEIAVPDGLVLIPGAELHPPNPYKGEEYHLIALNISREIRTEGIAHPQEILDAILDQGGVTFIGHPYWCKQSWTELAPLGGFLGVEVFNATCRRIGREDSTAQWDEYLNRVALCCAIATDDCHKREEDRTDTYLGWIMLKSEKKDRDAIMEAIRRGAYYASCGPEIRDLRVEETEKEGARTIRIRVETSPASGIAFVSDRGGARFGAFGACDETEISCAEYTSVPQARYVRVEVMDRKGRKAWTNPVPVSGCSEGGGSPAVLAGLPAAAPWASVHLPSPGVTAPPRPAK